jgi:transcriptional regulator with GAF, ATPase, and Fis domain
MVPLPQSVNVSTSAQPWKLGSVEREQILRTLDLTAWQIGGAGGAAEMLGLKPSTLRDRMRELGLRRKAGPDDRRVPGGPPEALR